ncbi:MAG: HipA N-terminal domain-containing protein [Bacteroidales bacterium]|nr:HipA N-terminal domain-containing protein [Bacteroidales bacterium]
MNVAEVKIWGELAGAVAWDEESGIATFEYNPGFKRSNLDLAPLKMPVSAAKNQYYFPELRKVMMKKQ